MVLIDNGIFYSINYLNKELIIIYPNKVKDSYINVPESVFLEFKESDWDYQFFKRKIESKFEVYENDPITFDDELPDPEMPLTFDR